MATAIILASGKSTRMGAKIDKCFLSLGAKPVVAWSLMAFEKCREVTSIILVTRKDKLADVRGIQMMFGISKLKKVVIGGARRQDSVEAALKEIEPSERFVVIHDAARPCVTPELILETLKYAKRFGSGIAAHPVVDTIKVVGEGLMAVSTPDRKTLWAVQTPQTFALAPLLEAHAKLAGKTEYTDDAAMLEACGTPTRLVKWEAPNPKLTTPTDLTIAAALLKLS